MSEDSNSNTNKNKLTINNYDFDNYQNSLNNEKKIDKDDITLFKSGSFNINFNDHNHNLNNISKTNSIQSNNTENKLANIISNKISKSNSQLKQYISQKLLDQIKKQSLESKTTADITEDNDDKETLPNINAIRE